MLDAIPASARVLARLRQDGSVFSLKRLLQDQLVQGQFRNRFSQPIVLTLPASFRRLA